MDGTVLIVEDNPMTRKVVRLALVGEGYEVVEAETGSMALDEMRRKPADLVLQDLALCDMDGFELIGRLRGMAATGTPILAFTGLTNEERIRAAGFDGLLVKPVEPSRLVEVVRGHLVGRDARTRVATPGGITPDTTTRDRAWHSMAAMLARLTELTGGDLAVTETVANVLASFLDASGFSVGAAYLYTPDGRPGLCAQLGFSPARAQDLSRLCEHHAGALPAPTHDLSCCVQAVFERAGASSIMTIPLTLGARRVGMLVLGTANDAVPGEWSRLAGLVAGSLAQTVVLARTVAQLAASEHKFRSISESTADGIVLTNASGQITYLNPAAEQIVGSDGQQTVGQSVVSVIPVADAGAWHASVQRADGSEIPVEISVRSFEDPPGHENRVYTVRNLSERTRLKELTHLANHDPLTGLFNRRRFEEDLGSRLAECRRHGTTGALLVIDLDRFKPINDTFGHQAGDAVVKAVGEVLRQNTRESDAAGRPGGDEFVVLLNHTDAAGAQICASKLLERISNVAVACEGHTLRVGASIGVALFPEHGTTAESIFRAADAALYRSKRLGRNCVSVCTKTTGDDGIRSASPTHEGRMS